MTPGRRPACRGSCRRGSRRRPRRPAPRASRARPRAATPAPSRCPRPSGALVVGGGADERLHLDQQRARALDGAHHRRTRGPSAVGEERRIGYRPDRSRSSRTPRARRPRRNGSTADDPVRCRSPSSRERCRTMLERLGASQAVLGDVADEEGRQIAPFGHEEQLGRDLADLADATGCRGEPREKTVGTPESRRRAPREPISSRMRSTQVSASRKSGAPPMDARRISPAAPTPPRDVEDGAVRARGGEPPPLAAASICRSPGRRRGARARGRTPPPSTRFRRTRRCPRGAGGVVRLEVRSRGASRRRAAAMAAGCGAAARDLAGGRAPRPTCSTHRSRDSGRATSPLAATAPGDTNTGFSALLIARSYTPSRAGRHPTIDLLMTRGRTTLAYDERLADWVRLVRPHRRRRESMFGGVCVHGARTHDGRPGSDDLVIRVAAADYERLLAEPHALTDGLHGAGRCAVGFYVAPEGVTARRPLARGVRRAPWPTATACRPSPSAAPVPGGHGRPIARVGRVRGSDVRRGRSTFQ